MPFDDDEEIGSQPSKTGVKLNNSKSMFANTQKKPSPENFQQQINAIGEKTVSYSERALDLSNKFMKMIEDRTLPENKNIFMVDLEKELLTNLVNLAVDINTDENIAEDGMGSIGLISLLFRSLILQRDKINKLEYSFFLLEQKIKNLESKSLDTNKNNE